MEKNLRAPSAPSMAAASRTLRGIDSSPAMNSRTSTGSTFQVSANTIIPMELHPPRAQSIPTVSINPILYKSVFKYPEVSKI